MKGYSEYKESSIEWIGKIPKHWLTSKLKFYADVTTGNTPSMKFEDYYDQHEGVPWVKPCDLEGFKEILSSKEFLTELAVKEARIVKKRAILIRGIGDTGKLGIEGCDLTTNQQIHAIEAIEDKIDPGFLKFVLYSAKNDLVKDSSNVVLSILTKTKLSNLEIPVASKSEQTQIAAFLDYHTGLIDALIAKKEALIEKLKQQRQSIVNEVVTGKKVWNAATNSWMAPEKTKDSGIEWLSEIPEGWEIVKLKHLGSCQNGVSQGPDYFGEGFPFVSYSDVYKNEILPTAVNLLANSNLEEQERYSVKEGDVFFTRTSETIEEIGIASVCVKTIEKAVFARFLIRFRPERDIMIPSYCRYYFRSYVPRVFLMKEMNFVTRASLSQELLTRLPVYLPCAEEQLKISIYLDEKCNLLDNAVSTIIKAIDKLKFYRQSLISEAVTGKIDVSSSSTEI
jgi:type I restriction enzyme S subunit